MGNVNEKTMILIKDEIIITKDKKIIEQDAHYEKLIVVETISKETPPTEVLAELIPIIYLTENAEIKNGYIKVVLW